MLYNIPLFSYLKYLAFDSNIEEFLMIFYQHRPMNPISFYLVIFSFHKSVCIVLLAYLKFVSVKNPILI